MYPHYNLEPGSDFFKEIVSLESESGSGIDMSSLTASVIVYSEEGSFRREFIYPNVLKEVSTIYLSLPSGAVDELLSNIDTFPLQFYTKIVRPSWPDYYPKLGRGTLGKAVRKNA